MPANKIVILGPVALTATLTTNIWSPPTLTGGTGVPPVSTNTYYIIRHIRFVNTNASSRSVTLFKDATAGNTAGKEIIANALAIAGNSVYDWYGLLRISSDETDKFIVGGATATGVTIQGEAEMGVV